jgi:hypothetical protein
MEKLDQLLSTGTNVYLFDGGSTIHVSKQQAPVALIDPE